jgi:hypothetical protein
MTTLNLGAGRRIIAGAVNLDIFNLPGIDIVYDLNQTPWDFAVPEGGFDKVIAHAILEHLKLDLVEAMNEIWGVCAVGAELRVKVPWHRGSLYNGLHRWMYSIHSFDIFDPRTRNGQVYDYYTPRKWHKLNGYLGRGNESLHFQLRKVG